MTAAPEPANPVLEAARHYASLGLRVIPIRPGEKRPTLTDWPEVATTNPERIRLWFGIPGRFAIGIVCGAASGIFVVDVDHTDQKRGDLTIARLQAEFGPLPSTVTALTGGGGAHLYFLWNPLHPVGTNASRLGPGLDVRGEGGQVVAPPSVHANGTPYRWAPGCAPGERPFAEAPGWLLALLAEDPEPPRGPPGNFPSLAGRTDEDSPAAWYNANHTWDELLVPDGWQLRRTFPDGEQHWTRPGKDPRHGISATVNHQGRDCLKVFTSSVPGLDEGVAYSRFGYTAAVYWNGDRSGFARELRHQMPHPDPSDLLATRPPPQPTRDLLGARPAEPGPEDPEAEPADDWAHEIHWPTAWDKDRTNQERWLIWPLVPAGRAVALYGPAKGGKSYLALYAAAAAVTGTTPFGGPPPEGEPPTVLYLDFEMTEDDVMERLEEFGYGPGDDLSRFHYCVLPSIEPLDTAAGAIRLMGKVAECGADLVVIDTFGRAVAGEENSADTTRGFYRHSGRALKQAQVAVLRTDHSGKDLDKGQRGSSAKQDDVDIVWRVARRENGARLTRTHSRISWGPTQLELLSATDDDGITTFRSAGGVATVPAGTIALAAFLDQLNVPLAATNIEARAALRKAEKKASNEKVAAALRYRREATEKNPGDLFGAPERSRNAPERSLPSDVPEPTDQNTNPQLNGTGTTDRNERNDPSSHTGTVPLSKRGPFRDHTTDEDYPL